nr:hypothetical protein 2 [Thermoactinomycetaceae bacterium]
MKVTIHRAILYSILCIVGLVLVYGIYFIPDNHALVNVNDPDKTALQISIMANQISSMNYLLTFIGLAGAVAGVAFTIFGYYQSTKFPQLVQNEVNRQMEIFKEKEDRNNKRIKEEIIKKLNKKEFKIYQQILPQHLESEVEQTLWMYDHNVSSIDELELDTQCELLVRATTRLVEKYKDNANALEAIHSICKEEINSFDFMASLNGKLTDRQIHETSEKYIHKLNKLFKVILTREER